MGRNVLWSQYQIHLRTLRQLENNVCLRFCFEMWPAWIQLQALSHNSKLTYKAYWQLLLQMLFSLTMHVVFHYLYAKTGFHKEEQKSTKTGLKYLFLIDIVFIAQLKGLDLCIDISVLFPDNVGFLCFIDS